MQANKTGWIVAVVVILVAAAVWWYVSGTASMPASTLGKQGGAAVTSPMPVLGNQNAEEMIVVPAATDTVDVIEKDLNAADSGNADLNSDIDSLGSDIEKGL